MFCGKLGKWKTIIKTVAITVFPRKNKLKLL